MTSSPPFLAFFVKSLYEVLQKWQYTFYLACFMLHSRPSIPPTSISLFKENNDVLSNLSQFFLCYHKFIRNLRIQR